jgi:DNA-binding MarR family transcriptional regulator
MAATSYNETLARRLVAEVHHVTADRPAPWVTPQQIARRLKVHHGSLAAAVRVAVDSGWLIAEGSPPHSISLTDAGRSLVKQSARARPRRVALAEAPVSGRGKPQGSC